jgi:hypothetical protein
MAAGADGDEIVSSLNASELAPSFVALWRNMMSLEAPVPVTADNAVPVTLDDFLAEAVPCAYP